MSKLTEVKLKGYKCYNKDTTVPIAPLTILCGKNNSGKSAFLKSLLTLKQSCESKSTYNSILLNGKYVNNGVMGDVSYSHTGTYCDTIELGMTAEFNPKDWASQRHLREYSALAEVLATNKPIKMSVSVEIQKKISLQDVENTIKRYVIRLSVEERPDMEIRLIKAMGEDDSAYMLEVYNFILPNGEELFKGTKHLGMWICQFEGMRVTSMLSNEIKYNYSQIVPSILSIMKAVSYITNGVRYIAPIRSEIPRRFYRIEDADGVGIFGETTADVLKNKQGKSVRFAEAPKKDKFNKKPEIVRGAMHVIKQWSNYLGIGADVGYTNYYTAINLVDGRRNLTDKGIGLSQALPIVVEGVTMEQGDTLMIEQPESHMYPQSQMAMADFLLATALSGKNVIAETHSDHIINRLVRRIAEDESLAEVVKIYYIDEGKFLPIHIDKYEGIDNAPEDFFTQFGSETMAISQALVANYKRDKLSE